MRNPKILLLIAAFFAVGCYNDIEEELYGSCVTSNIHFQTVTQVLSANGCNGCHSGAGASAGIDLSTYTGISTVAQNGRLYGSISQSAGFKAMPQGGAKMSACDISRIKAWIDAGAPNN
jgi:hypothetical protein